MLTAHVNNYKKTIKLGIKYYKNIEKHKKLLTHC